MLYFFILVKYNKSLILTKVLLYVITILSEEIIKSLTPLLCLYPLLLAFKLLDKIATKIVGAVLDYAVSKILLSPAKK